MRLIGPDEVGLRERWSEIQAAGGVELPVIDASHYGDIALERRRHASGAAPVHDPGGGHAGQAPVIYRYEFTDGRLAAARAWGPATDHLLRVEATYDWTCQTAATTSYIETMTAICEEASAESPELVFDCHF